MKEWGDARLGDIGERKIVSEILAKRYRAGNATFGDDVADFGSSSGTLVATTDPAPRPAVWDLGPEDYFDWGWLLGALNLSDIAASGALPLGLLTSYTLPNETPVRDFVRLLDGVDAVAKECGTIVRGGNLKEGYGVVEATALGVVDGRPMSRLGAEPGDGLYAFGEVGAFWGALLTIWDSLATAEQSLFRDALVRPRPLVSVGHELRVTGVAKAMTDASDGLYAAFVALSVEQGLGFVFQPRGLELSDRVVSWSRTLNVDPVRLALGFGNLELVCAADPRHEPRLRQIAQRSRVQFTRLGAVTDEAVLRVELSSGDRELNNFDNERFSSASQFTGGLAAYRERLLLADLVV